MDAPAPSEASADKRKAIDLTRSDSENDDDAAKRARRAGEAAAHDVDDPTPWEAPEWKARCAAKRAKDGKFHHLLGGLMGELGSRINMDKSDEEYWREIHDPVGAYRLELRRICSGSDMRNLDVDAYVEKKVAEFVRKRNGPCTCRYEGADKCVSQTAAHDCVCTLCESSYKRDACKSTTHDCVCRRLKTYELDSCKGTTHDCICHRFKSYETNECKSATHACICVKHDGDGDCKSATHDCICPTAKSYKRDQCKSAKHTCICRGLKNYELDSCKAGKHLCICGRLKDYEKDTCKAAKHLS